MKALALVLWLASFPLAADPGWFLSDPLGNDLGPFPKASAGKGWFLRVESRSGTEERTLFHDREVDSVRLLDLDPVGRVLRSRDLRQGEAIWEVSFDPTSGLPTTETLFAGNKPHEVATLTFRDRVLSAREVRDGAGALLFRDSLFLWPDGKLRRLERDGPDGPLAEVSWSYAAGQLVRVWSVDEQERDRGQHRERLYAAGRTEETLATETSAVESRVTEALALGNRDTRTDATQKVEVRTSDAAGRPLEEVVTVKGTVMQSRHWTYDAQGRVLTTVVESGGPTETTTYSYSDGLVVAALSRDGIPVREETTREGEKVRVKLYDRGALFLEELWDAGKRTKEIYYQDGRVVRERTP